MYTEESVEGGYAREKEERTTENKMERRVSTRFEKYWTESGRGDGQGMWRRKIISYTGDPTLWEKPEEKKKKKRVPMGSHMKSDLVAQLETLGNSCNSSNMATPVEGKS